MPCAVLCDILKYIHDLFFFFNFALKCGKKFLIQLTSALYSRRRSEGSPERLGAELAAGGHVEADGHELVPLQHHRHDLPGVPGVAQDGGRRVVVRLPRLPLASVQNLEDPGDLLGVCSDHVTLGHRSHMEHLTHEYYSDDISGNLFRDNVDKQAETAWISLNRNTGKGWLRDR